MDASLDVLDSSSADNQVLTPDEQPVAGPSCHSNDDCHKPSCLDGHLLVTPSCLLDFYDDTGKASGHCVLTETTCEKRCYQDLQNGKEPQCDCDFDGDGAYNERCGGDDCDDRNVKIHPGAQEVCNGDGIDEDCDSNTFNNQKGGKNLDGDGDEDGYVNNKCYNINPKTGARHGGDDCDDTRKDVNPKAQEVCDNVDNDCNGLVDEKAGEKVSGGLRTVFWRDNDGDKYGNDKDARVCCDRPDGFVKPEGEQAKPDCDDSNPKINPGQYEICDGIDNDCDSKTDEESSKEPLVDRPTFHVTDVECVDGGWKINTCPEDWVHCSESVLEGCETPANKLSTCRACSTHCLFSCGERGCDEIEKISVGPYHTCAVTNQGRAACWGINGSGQIGDGSDSNSFEPSLVILSDVKDISAGGSHTCAIAGADNKLYCWGSNEFGQIANQSGATSNAIPNRVVGPGNDLQNMSHVTSIATGNQHSCAVYGEGMVVCWGNQKDGRLGNEEDTEYPINFPQRVVDYDSYFVENGVQVVAGYAHSCLLTKDGKVMCWGSNSSSQLGVEGVVEEPSVARPVQELNNIIGTAKIQSITAGYFHTCALSNSGKVYCWGNNERKQLGHSGTAKTSIPKEVPSIDNIAAITAGNYHTCAFSRTKGNVCWGSNEYGELGYKESKDDTLQPQTLDIRSVDWVAAGGGVSCARTDNAQIECWGNNSYGQFGIDRLSSEFHPLLQYIHALKGSIQ